MDTGKLLSIAIKPGPRSPMTLVDSAAVTLEEGLAGDSRGSVRTRQVTLVAREAWADACHELGTELPWTARRANLLIEGFSLQHTTGRVLHIGPVKLEVTGETLPCGRMDEAHPGLQQALVPDWRAGITASVLSPGIIRVGDHVVWQERDQS